MDITMFGLNMAKNVFQVHGINDGDDVIVRRRLRCTQVSGFFASFKTDTSYAANLNLIAAIIVLR